MRLQEITTRDKEKNSLESSSEDTPGQEKTGRKRKIFLVLFDHIWHNLVFELKTITNVIMSSYTSLRPITYCLLTMFITLVESWVGSDKSVTPKKLHKTLLNVISIARELRGGVLLMQLLKLDEVRAELGISRTTLWRLRDQGLIKSCRLGGLIWVTRGDLDHFIRQELLAGRSR
jgi:hypothetical protein